MSDDITFCMSECGKKKCFRHPSNIIDRTRPQSYSEFKGTAYCPLEYREPDVVEVVRCKDCKHGYVYPNDANVLCEYFGVPTYVTTIAVTEKGEKMYESPISVLYNDVVEGFESGIMRAIQQVDIVVDKEELIKALAYDRDSYRKGYKDGMRTENEIWMARLKDVIECMKEVEDDKGND